jgi:taurine dioxygenase
MEIVARQEPFAVELKGLDPSSFCDEDGPRLRELLVEHKVILFRDIEVTPEQQVKIMSLLGRVITEMPESAHLPYPNRAGGKVSYVTTEPGEYISGRDALTFHSDFSFYVDGAADAISLYAVDVERDDPTKFVDMTAVAEFLPIDTVDRLRKLSLVKCANFFHNTEDYGTRYRYTDRDPGKDYGNTVSVQPAVLRHPRSGSELINICQTFTSHVKGWSYEASDAIFGELEAWMYRSDRMYRHHWRSGDLVIWDNVALQHGRDPLRESYTRHLRRVVTNPWDVSELQARSGAALPTTDPSLLPATTTIIAKD